MNARARSAFTTIAIALVAMLILGVATASAQSPPALAVNGSSEVGVTSAKLEGEVNPEGETGSPPTYFHFEVSADNGSNEPDGNWIFVNGTPDGEISGTEAEEANFLPVEGIAESLQPATKYFIRLVADNAEFSNHVETGSPFQSFETAPASAPVLTVQPASGVGFTTATLHGKVDPEGGNVNPIGGPLPINWQFEYREEGQASWSFGGSGELTGAEAESSAPIDVETELPFGTLQASKHYEFHLFAYYLAFSRNVDSPRLAFETQTPAAPDATIEPVSPVTGTSAHFSGHVNPNAPGPEPQDPGSDVSWHFQCMPACPDLSGTVAADNADHLVEAEATGLTPHTLYKVSLVAKNQASAEVIAGPQTFTTEAVAPKVGSTFASEVSGSTATVNAKVNPGGASTTVHFDYVTQQQFAEDEFAQASSTPESSSVGADASEHLTSADISGLNPGTTYRFRVVAGNEKAPGGIAGPTALFHTESPSPGPQSCPNANSLGAAQLPDCRAWEMVSPPDKNGGNIIGTTARTRASADGNAIQFSSTSGFADAPAFNVSTDYLANRTARPGTNGWSTHGIDPVQESIPIGLIAGSAVAIEAKYQGELSADLDRGVFFAYSPVPTADDPHEMVAQSENLYLRTDLKTPGAGSYQLLTDCPVCTSPLGLQVTPFRVPRVIGTNAGDASHEALTNVLYKAFTRLTADAPAGETKLYEGLEHPTEEIQTVSVDATAGQFVLEFEGQSTGDLAFDATAGAVQAALNGLSSIAPGSVSVTGGPGDAGATSPYVVSFPSGAGIEGTDVPQIDATSGTTPLSGGGATISTDTRLQGGQHVRLVSRIPTGEAIECDDRAAPACEGSAALAPSQSTPGSTRLISDDGSRAIFLAGSPVSLYLREDGVRTVKLNASEKASPDEPKGANYQVASTDGQRIFFTTTEQLVDADTSPSADLYMYDASKPASAPDNLTLISTGSGGSGGSEGVAPVMGASADGHYVYLTTNNQLIAGEPNFGGGTYIYLWHDGTLTYIGYVESGLPNSNASNGQTRTATLDGRHLLFVTQDSAGLVGQGGFEGYDHGHLLCGAGPCREAFVYSADSGTLRCASCNPAGVSTATNGATFLGEPAVEGSTITYEGHINHPISDDGRYVFFSTGERLVPEDTNGRIDVYEYDTQTEEQHLISSGESPSDTYFSDASANGHDVFFDTADRLSRWDTDNAYDIYDARVGGGLPEPPLPPPSCQGDACQPTPPALNDPTPSSSSFNGPGNQKSSKTNRRGCPKGKHRVKSRGKSHCVKAHKKHKRATKSNRRAGR